MVHVYCEGSKVIISKIKLYFLSEGRFVLAFSVDPDEIPHYAAFHLGLYCLPRFTFRSQKLI